MTLQGEKIKNPQKPALRNLRHFKSKDLVWWEKESIQDGEFPIKSQINKSIKWMDLNLRWERTLSAATRRPNWWSCWKNLIRVFKTLIQALLSFTSTIPTWRCNLWSSSTISRKSTSMFLTSRRKRWAAITGKFCILLCHQTYFGRNLGKWPTLM